MNVLCFDTHAGIYRIETAHMKTTLHSHPATEIILATSGSFDITSRDHYYADVKFAIIGANIQHAVFCKTANLTITLFEHRDAAMCELAKSAGVILQKGIGTVADPSQAEHYHQTMMACAPGLLPGRDYDPRIAEALRWIESNLPGNENIPDQLASLTHLSQSRLSHLFKAHVGISIRKYVVWARLKRSIALYVSQPTLLMDALLVNGFYDPSHFTRAFKKMLGVVPSHAYNSRSVQLVK